MQEPPSLLCQKGIIEHSKISKTHTSNRLRFCHFLPFNPMDFPSVIPLAPPKFLDLGLNLIAQTQRQFESPHSVSRDGLYDCL